MKYDSINRDHINHEHIEQLLLLKRINCKASHNGKIPWDESTKQRRIIVFSLNEIQNFSQTFCPTFRDKT
jgi:hypothetical protein